MSLFAGTTGSSFLILPAKFTLCPSIHVYTPWKPHVVCGDFQGKKRSPCFIDMLPATPWGILRIFPQKQLKRFNHSAGNNIIPSTTILGKFLWGCLSGGLVALCNPAAKKKGGINHSYHSFQIVSWKLIRTQTAATPTPIHNSMFFTWESKWILLDWIILSLLTY